MSNLTGQKVIFPFYHAVANTVPAHLKHLYSVRNIQLFEKDLHFLSKDYKPISIKDAKAYYNNNSEKAACFTFDDGLREFKEVAWPILKKHEIPVALFINTAFVDNKELFYRFKASLLMDKVLNKSNISFRKIEKTLSVKLQNKESLIKIIMQINYSNREELDALALLLEVDFEQYLKDKKPYLTTDELRELHNEGILIGAHSHDHPLFNELSFDEQLNQVTKSMDWVSENFQQSIKAFSFPFTDFGVSKELFKKLYEEDNSLLDISMGTAGIKKENFQNHLQRIPMENNYKSAKKILLKEYLYYIVKATFNKNTIQR